MDRDDQGGFSNQHSESELLDAREAAALLGVKLATLYAYVSRGLIRSVPATAADERGHRYARGNLLRLKTRAEARSGHGPVAAAALDFGAPVLESALTEVDAAGQRYRGYSAVELACQGVPFEAVAELLWSGQLPASRPVWPAKLVISPDRISALLPAGTPPLSVLALLVPALANGDPARFAAPPENEKERGRQILYHLAAGLALAGAPDCLRFREALKQASIASAIAVALGKSAAEGQGGINRALVLMADHELNMSTFAARVAASAGADLYACIGAALAAASGSRHGGACDRVEALIAEVERVGDAAAVVRERLRRGESVPGFGQPLYPAGDPRTPPLLELAGQLAGPPRGAGRGVFTVTAVIQAMRDAGHPPPTVDMGLVALSLALKLPPGSASCLFVLGRVAGWVAHVLEQRESAGTLRPRARYIGPPRRGFQNYAE